MIELSEEQRQAVQQAGEVPVTVVDPTTTATYVLLPENLYEKLKGLAYDDSPWSAEERELLAWEAGKKAGWDNMDEYDHYEKQP